VAATVTERDGEVDGVREDRRIMEIRILVNKVDTAEVNKTMIRRANKEDTAEADDRNTAEGVNKTMVRRANKEDTAEVDSRNTARRTMEVERDAMKVTLDARREDTEASSSKEVTVAEETYPKAETMVEAEVMEGKITMT